MHFVLFIVSCYACIGLALKSVPKHRRMLRMKHSSRWNNSCISPLDSDLNDDVVEYAAISYAKAGTELMWKLVELVADNVQMPYQHCLPSHKSTVCAPGTVVQYNGDNENSHTVDILKCPGIRGMHLMRRPTSMLVSDYIYTKNGELWGNFEDDRIEWRKRIAKMSVPKGIQWMCSTMQSRARVMVESFEAIINNTQFLKLRIEQFAENFNATTRSIWEHFRGNNALENSEFVRKASKWDFKRDPKLKESGKYADEKLTEEAIKEVENLKDDTCIKTLMRLDMRLGYTKEDRLFLNLPKYLA